MPALGVDPALVGQRSPEQGGIDHAVVRGVRSKGSSGAGGGVVRNHWSNGANPRKYEGSGFIKPTIRMKRPPTRVLHG